MEIKLSKETTMLAEALVELRGVYYKCLDAFHNLEERKVNSETEIETFSANIAECFCNFQDVILDRMKDGIANNPKGADNEL